MTIPRLSKTAGLELMRAAAIEMLNEDKDELVPEDYDRQLVYLMAYTSAHQFMDWLEEYTGMEARDLMQWIYFTLAEE